MKKEKIFSKFNTRNFNNELEEVLEDKLFSENVKNNILNVIYKIEEAYNDYKLVKVEVANEKEFLGNILEAIKKNCNLIDISTTNELKEKKYIIDYKKGNIQVYSNDIWILYSIFEILKNKQSYHSELDLTQNKPIYDILNLGYSINNVEVIRDFNGWSWINSLEEENIKINLIYQNLQFILSNKFMENYMKNIITQNNDFVKILNNKIQKKYNEDISQEIIDIVRKISIIEIANINEQYREKILEIKQQKLEEYNLMENKKEYLKEITNIKKQNNEIIKNIDKLINDTELLKAEYRLRNSRLKNSEKIFSVSCLVDILNNERKEALDKIAEINNLMDPKTYVRKKEKIQNIINELSVDEKNSEEYIIELQKIFIKCFLNEIELVTEKADIINILYKIRYCINILFCKNKYIKDVIELKEEIESLKEKIIEKLLKNKLVSEFSDDNELNKKILMNILNTRIINLQKIYIALKKDKEKLEIEIYDEDELYKIEEIDFKNLNNKNLKLNKKIKIFI